jgi:WD40 repeat protein
MSAAGSTSPFVGPKPFEQDQAHLFKGREHEVERLEALVLSRRAVLFYAASGVGKSSLVNAGLVPKLRGGERGLECEVLGVVRVSAAVGSKCNENLFTKSVLGQLKDGVNYSSLLDYLKDKYTSDKQAETGGVKLVLLVIDQFEELFTTSPECWRDRLPFMRGLLEALDACAAADPVVDREEGCLFKIMHLRVVFCLREEYIAYLEQYYDLFPELRTARFRLEPLRREQARRAIVEPTRKSGRAFSEDLVEEIISELIEAPQVTARDARPKPRSGWAPWLVAAFRRAFFHVPEVGHRDQQYVVEGEYVEPVQLQVICSDIWESTAQGEKVISRQSLPKGWSVDAGLGQFYDQAIDFACRRPSEPLPSSSSLWSQTVAFVGLRPLSPIRMRKWISKSLITAMGTRAPVLVQDAEMEIPGGVLERLQNRYLLRLEPRFGADWLELAHDRLVGPITRSNARHIAASNHNRAGLVALALFAVVGGLGWRYVREASATDARLALVADMKKEIVGEPDLGVLIQACAKSGLQDPAAGAECTARAEGLSQDIVIKEGLEQSVSRQPELYAYVHNRLGAITELARQGGAYRALLDNGKYFVTSFEKPVNPSSGDLKVIPPCGHANEMKGLSPSELGDALRLCSSSDLLRGLGVQSPAVGAVDDARQFAVVSQCDSNGCATTVSNLDGQNSEPIPVKHDVEPVPSGGSVSRVEVSGNMLVYALCEQGAAKNCPATAKIYRLSDDRRDARLVASLPGNFDLLAMAASQDNVAVAYRSIGGFIRVKVYPTQFTKPDPPWLPDGTRVFDMPFDSISSLIFDESGKYLVASAEDGYLVHWKLDGHVFGEVPWEVAKLGAHQFAQSMTVSANGDIVATGLGSGKGRNRDDGCIRIGEIKDDGVSEIANSSKCTDAGSLDEPMPIGWNIVAMDNDGKILVAASSFGRGGRGLLLRKHKNVFDKQAADFPPDVTTASISTDGAHVVIADRSEAIYSMEEANGAFERTYIGTIDSSCVRFSGAQHRVSAISFYGKDNAKFLVATQEGCLALFEKDASGWKPRLIDTQMPDVTTVSVSPDSRWAVLGTTSGRIQIWDLHDLRRLPATVDARLPWSSTFAWLSPGKGAEGQWMILGNSRFGPVGSWLVKDSDNGQQPPAVAAIFPPTWVDKMGIVGVSAVNGSLLAATTDGRLLRLSNVGAPQAIVDRLIERACEISSPLVGDKTYPPSTAKTDDDAFISEVMSWARKRCQPPTLPPIAKQ